MTKCNVIGCNLRNRRSSQKITIHRLPRNEIKKQKWLDLIGTENLRPFTKEVYICSLHFDESSFNRTMDIVRLRDDAMPTRFLTPPSGTECGGAASSRIRRTRKGKKSVEHSSKAVCTMAPVKCYYNGCFNTSATKSLFSFPIKDEPRLELWLKHSGNAQLASLTHQELRHRYICQDHFEADVILKNAMRSRLVPTAVPHMFKSVTSQYTDSAASKPENELQDPLRDDEDSNESNHQTLLDKETADKGRGRVRVVCICNGCSNVISGFRYICVQCTDVDLCGACEASGLHELHYLLRVPRQRPEKEISSILGKIREELMKYENIVESIEIDMEDGPDPLGVVQRNYTDARCSTEVSSDHEMNTHNKRSRMEMEEFLNKDRNASSHITTESVSAVPNNEKEFDSSPNIKVEADVSEEERCEVFVHKDPVSSELKTMSTHLSDPNIIQRPTIEKNQLQTNGLVPTLVVSNFIVPTTYVVVTGATPMASIGMLGYPTMVPQTLPGVPPDVLGMQRDRPGVKPGRYFVKVTGTDTNERNGDQLQENQ